MSKQTRSAMFLQLILACAGCDPATAAPDLVDAAITADAGTPSDTGVAVDGGTGGCAADEHDCAGVCTENGVNDPATGCRLGCGEACPGGTMAMCDAEGNCGIRGCVPDTCEDMGVTCGPIEDGCGARRNCGTCDLAGGLACVAGACACTPDSDEPGNDSRTGLSTATSIDDSVEPDPFPLEGTLHESTDEDWYQVAIVDGSDGGSPVVRVELVTAPAGSDYEVAAFFGCDDTSGTNTTSCSAGANDDSVEQGCTSAGQATDLLVMDTSCGGFLTDEHGTLWIRVRAASWASTCGVYTVRVSAS